MSDSWGETGEKVKGKERLLIGVLFFVVAGVAGMGLVHIFRKDRPGWITHTAAELPLPVLGKVENFELLESSGKPIGLKELLGRPWVANFIYSRCKNPCPTLIANMSLLQGEISKRVRLVSFSVDPEFDTPQVLSDLAKSVNAEPDRWLFITGKKEELYRVVKEIFKLFVKENPQDKEAPVSHTTHFVLVDQKGNIRGFYSGDKTPDLFQLKQDINKLLDKP